MWVLSSFNKKILNLKLSSNIEDIWNESPNLGNPNKTVNMYKKNTRVDMIGCVMNFGRRKLFLSVKDLPSRVD